MESVERAKRYKYDESRNSECSLACHFDVKHVVTMALAGTLMCDRAHIVLRHSRLHGSHAWRKIYCGIDSSCDVR